MKPRFSHHLSPRAFSLTEVALALGIFSFCAVSMVGLLPVALNAYRASIDTSVSTRIIQTLRAEVAEQPFSSLPAQMRFYFDDEGAPVPANDSLLRYEVQGTVVPGTRVTGASLDSVATIRLVITNRETQAARSASIHLADNGF